MLNRHLSFVMLCSLALPFSSAFGQPLPIQEIKRETSVDFQTEILPILQKNCISCHNSTEAENRFNAETPQTILKGGSEGVGIVPGNSLESYFFQLAGHIKEPVMPPADNSVGAKNLTAQELGLLKLWIDQGGKGEVKQMASDIQWQPLPPELNSILAIAITPDSQYAAVAKANRIALYHIPSKREVARLTDPSLASRGVNYTDGAADLDMIQSLHFSHDGKMLASGGFRTAKIWQRPEPNKKRELAKSDSLSHALVIAPNGQSLAIGEESGSIRIIDVASGAVKATLAGHTAPVKGIAFTSDSNQLVSGSIDKTVRLWNLAESKQIASLENPVPVQAVCLCNDGKFVAVGGQDNNVRIWNLPAPPVEGQEPPKPVKELGHGGAINFLATSNANTNWIISGSQDGQMRIWDINNGNVVKQLTHHAAIESVSQSKDQSRYITVGSNQIVRIFQGDNNQQLPDLKGNINSSIAFGASQRNVNLSKKIAAAAKKDLEDAQKRKTTEEENQKKAMEDSTKSEAEFQTKTEAAKQPTIDKETADKNLFDGENNKKLAETKQKEAGEKQVSLNKLLDEANKVRDQAVAAFNEANTKAQQAIEVLNQAKTAATADAANTDLAAAVEAAQKKADEAEQIKKTAEALKVQKETEQSTAQQNKTKGDEEKQNADKALNDANTAFNQATEKVKQITPIYQKAVDEKLAAERNMKAAKRSVERAMEFVNQATQVIPNLEATLRQTEENQKQAEAQLQQSQTIVSESEKAFHASAISPDGSTVATAGDGLCIQTWDTKTGTPRDVFPNYSSPFRQLAYLADGSIVATANDNTVTVWESLTSWNLVRTVGSIDKPDQIIDRVTALDFSHDNKFLATGSGEPSRGGEVKIWSVQDGGLIRALNQPHSDCVYGLEFSPDDQRLASSAADRLIKIFNVNDGSLVKTMEGHTHHVLGLAWRMDGRSLASAGADNVVKIWNARTGDQIATVQGFNKEVTGVQFVAETDQAIAASGSKLVRMFDSNNGNTMRDFGGSTDFISSLAVTADGQLVLAGGKDGILRMWRVDNAQIVHTFDK